MKEIDCLILATAQQRAARTVLPLPPIKGDKREQDRAIARLLKRKLIELVPLAHGEVRFEDNGKGEPKMLRLTTEADAALEIGGNIDEVPPKDGAAGADQPNAQEDDMSTKTKTTKQKTAKARKAGQPRAAANGEGRAFRPDSKQAKMVAAMKRQNGATIEQLAEITGWKKGSVHGVIANGIEGRMKLKVDRIKEEGKPVRFHIAA